MIKIQAKVKSFDNNTNYPKLMENGKEIAIFVDYDVGEPAMILLSDTRDPWTRFIPVPEHWRDYRGEIVLKNMTVDEEFPD